MQCEMIGCRREIFNSLSIGPGTYVPLCRIHYDSVKANLGVVDDEHKGTNATDIAGMDKVA